MAMKQQPERQLEQEPVAWYDKHGMITHDPFEGVTPLYTSPPPRQWQELTEEETLQLSLSIPGNTEFKIAKQMFYEAISAALKKKNK